MKKLMLGNEAIARGLYEAGVRFVSSYPGTPSTEITECAAEYPEMYAEWAPNEKVAYEAALGASIAGARSATAMKHVGMNVAADPLFTSSYTGVNGGFVVIVADDPAMHSSQNEQDSRHYATAAKLPMLEPSNSDECLRFTKLAFEISEQFDTPVIVRTCTRVAHSQSLVNLNERVDVPLKKYEKNPVKYVMSPANGKVRHVEVEKRLCALLDYAEQTPINAIEMGDRKVGFVTSSTAYLYVKEAFPNASILKLGMIFPLPIEKIRAFAQSVDALIVVEELDPVLETAIRAAGIPVAGGKDRFSQLGELSQRKVATAMGQTPTPSAGQYPEDVPGRPPVMCAGCPHRGLFYVLHKMNLTVLGDIGCYTLGASAPLAAVDTVVCMGASISAMHGFTKVLGAEAARKTVAVIGDSTFMHSGITGLVDVAYNKNIGTVLVLDNAITGMTGHQQNPTTGMTLQNEPTVKISIEKICEAAGIPRVRVADPNDMKVLEAAIREELDADEPSVIVVRRPCMLLKYVKPNPPLAVDATKCRGCRACMRLGCPAIRFENGKATIDETQCVGCGLCAQLCAFGAIGGKEEAK